MSIKILPPDIPELLSEAADIDAAVLFATQRREDVERLRFTGGTFHCDALGKGKQEFSGCVFERCTFDCHETKTFSFADVVFKNCDLSNVSFHKSAFLRCSFADCKALGAVFSESIWSNVTVRQSVFRYAAVSAAKLSNVRFAESDFSNGAFENCKFKEVAWENVMLDSAEFSFTPLKGVDLTSCSIRGISANPLDLRGAIIASHQAVDLAAMLGVVIR